MEVLGVVQLIHVDCLDLILVEPLNTLAIFPQTELLFAILRHVVSAHPMLFTSIPVALVAPAISPSVDAEAVFLVILVLTLVNSAIIPNIDTHTLHVILEPLALVAPSIKPRVDAYSADFVLPPISRILAAIIPLVATDAVFASISVISLIS